MRKYNKILYICIFIKNKMSYLKYISPPLIYKINSFLKLFTLRLTGNR